MAGWRSGPIAAEAFVSRAAAGQPGALGPVRVQRIGADGDGIGAGPEGPLYLAGTLPGELVRPLELTRRGEGWAGAAEVLEASAERVVPPCRHFGPCGGCALQHWADGPYAAWKRARVAQAVGVEPAGLARTPAEARRRMDFAVRREGPAVRIGLHRRRSAEVIDLAECPILDPALFRLVPTLRPVLAGLEGVGRQADLRVNLVDGGADVLLGTDRALSAGDRARLAGWAGEAGVVRVSWHLLGRREVEPAAVLGPARVTLSGRTTAVGPGAFLQASREGEAAIREAVMAALATVVAGRLRGPIVELFAGVGTLTHALAERAPVRAYEGDGAAVAALRGAGNGRVTVAQRDLARQPLRAEELAGAGAVVLDPPFAGAGPQMAALAGARVPVVYVSCNPGALARDGAVLRAAGFGVTGVAAIDQFLWSGNVEAVVGFRPG